MAELSRDLTENVARLARLELSDSEVALFSSQLSLILEYVDKLSELAVEGVEPLYHPFELNTSFRTDEVRVADPESGDASHTSSKILQCSSCVVNDGYQVPRMNSN